MGGILLTLWTVDCRYDLSDGSVYMYGGRASGCGFTDDCGL